MRKIACYMSLCLVMFVGVLAFAGCGNSTDVASIRIKDLPQQVYTVGDTLNLTNGSITVEYTNGNTADFEMLNCVDLLAYIEYGDGTTTNVFRSPSEAQVVVIQYKGRTTTFNVQVNKGTITEQDVNLNQSYTKVYTGSSLPISELSNLNLQDGVSVESVQYRKVGETISDFTTVAPVNAGEYVVRVNINGGANYESTYFETNYTIQKADLASLTSEGILNYPSINISFNENYDLTKNWQFTNNGTLSAITAGLDENIVNNLVYSYSLKGSTQFTTLNPDQDSGEISVANLLAGEYVVKVSGSWENNINNFEITTPLVIAQKTLIYGEDYEFKVTKQDGTIVEFTPSSNANDVQTIINFTAEETLGITVEIVWLNDNVEQNVVDTPVITFRQGANWETSIDQDKITSAGTYKIWVDVDFNPNTYHFDNDYNNNGNVQFNGIRIVVE